MKELIGYKILNVEMLAANGNFSGEEAIQFTVENNKPIVYLTYGDCCSETWFSEILNLDFLVGHTVSEVKELDMPDYTDNNSRQQEDKYYGYRITTEAGHCTIAFRNSSNGYYGGEIEIEDINRAPSVIRNWYSIGHLADWTAYQNTGKSYKSFLKLKAFI
jgi:hypothetical protein